MIQVKFGEQSNVRYNVGLLQKCVLQPGSNGVAIFLDGNPVVIDSAWSPTVKRTVDVESAEFYNRHTTDLQKPRRRYYFLVARFDMDSARQILPNSFRVEYLDLGSGTYKEFCDGSVAQPNYNGAVLTKVDKVVEGKNLSYIKPYASFIQLPADAQERVDKIKNDKNEVARLWDEFKKSVGIIDATTFENLLSGSKPVFGQPASQPVAQPVQQATQPVAQPTVQQPTQSTTQPAAGSTAAFGTDPFADCPF